MKKLFYFILGRWRILCDVCPWCRSNAPELYKCPVCKYNTIFPPPKEIKELWWIRYSAKVKLAEMEKEKPSKPRTGPITPKASSFTSTQESFMENLMREYVIPGLKEYRRNNSFYPPTEPKFLKSIFHRPDGISNEEWALVIKRVGEEIMKMEGEEDR